MSLTPVNDKRRTEAVPERKDPIAPPPPDQKLPLDSTVLGTTQVAGNESVIKTEAASPGVTQPAVRTAEAAPASDQKQAATPVVLQDEQQSRPLNLGDLVGAERAGADLRQLVGAPPEQPKPQPIAPNQQSVAAIPSRPTTVFEGAVFRLQYLAQLAKECGDSNSSVATPPDVSEDDWRKICLDSWAQDMSTTPTRLIVPTELKKSSKIRLSDRIFNSFKGVVGRDDPMITYAPTLQKINALEPQVMALTNKQLFNMTTVFRKRLAEGESMDDMLPEVFAVSREQAKRVLEMRPFDVQVVGGIVLHQGKIAEMGTGEGKTLTATMPAYLNAMPGKGVHVVTVNDTLAKRDSTEMGQLYKWQRLSVGFNTDEMSTEEKRAAYNSDITYMMNSTLGFDYERDNSEARSKADEVNSRPPQYAIVDEADQIFIDEARTPLIIAQSVNPSTEDYERFATVVKRAPYQNNVGRLRMANGDEITFTYKDNKVESFTKTRVVGEGKTESSTWALKVSDNDTEAVGKKKAKASAKTTAAANGPSVWRRVDVEPSAPEIVWTGEVSPRADLDSLALPGATYARSDKSDFQWTPPEWDEEYKARCTEFYKTHLEPGVDYKVDMKKKTCWIEDVGVEKLQKLMGYDVYDKQHFHEVHYLDAALKAEGLYRKDKDYCVNPETIKLEDGTVIQFHDKVRFTAMPGTEKTLAGESSEFFRRMMSAGQVRGTEISLPAATRAVALQGATIIHPDGTTEGLLEGATIDVPQGAKFTPKTVEIVDEFTGRIMDGRRFNDGLHQALEAKEGVPVQPEQRTMASITYPQLFRRYKKVAGMSGTAWTEREELGKLYGLDVVVIPPNKPSQRKDYDDLVYRTQKESYPAGADLVKRYQDEGKPVIVVTRSVEKNQYMHWLLSQRGLAPQVLNANSVKNNTEAENQMIVLAGKSGMSTAATNMAGRGVDIKPDYVNFALLAADTVENLGAGNKVAIIVPKPEHCQDVDLWLKANNIKTTGVPVTISELGKGLIPQIDPHVDPGEEATPLVQVIIDDREGKDYQKPPPAFVQEAMEKAGMSDKKAVVLDGCSERFDTGGLHIVIMERNESRRIDNQVKGRAGRQGHKGDTQFVLSLEDDLMRLFGDRMSWLFDKMGVQPGQAVQDPHLDKAIEKAQKKIEAMNFDVRKQTSEWDAVLNVQRELMYKDRKKIRGDWDVDFKENVDEAMNLAKVTDKATPKQAQRVVKMLLDVYGVPFAVPLAFDGPIDKDKLKDKALAVLQDCAQRNPQHFVQYFRTQLFQSFEGWIQRSVDKIFDEGLLKDMNGNLLATQDIGEIDNEEMNYREERLGTRITREDGRAVFQKFQDRLGIPADIMLEMLEKPIISTPGKKADKIETKDLKNEILNMLLSRAQQQVATLGADNFERFLRDVSLDAIDNGWCEHLENMQNMQSGVGLVGYAQKDPKVEYPKRAHELWDNMRTGVNTIIAHDVLSAEFRAVNYVQDGKVQTVLTTDKGAPRRSRPAQAMLYQAAASGMQEMADSGQLSEDQAAVGHGAVLKAAIESKAFVDDPFKIAPAVDPKVTEAKLQETATLTRQLAPLLKTGQQYTNVGEFKGRFSLGENGVITMLFGDPPAFVHLTRDGRLDDACIINLEPGEKDKPVAPDAVVDGLNQYLQSVLSNKDKLV